jgi:hypothetical protein
VIANTEERIIAEHGEAGRAAFYRTGKRFAYRYYNLLKLPPKPDPDWKKQVHFTFKFAETMYSSGVEDRIMPGDEELFIRAKDLVVCRAPTKLGHTLFNGIVCGVWAGALGNPKIEGVEETCEGLGAENCVYHSGKQELLRTGFPKKRIINAPDMQIAKNVEEYKQHNFPTNIEGPSLHELINSYYFNYKAGHLVMRGERFFPIEIGFIYHLQDELHKIGAVDVLEEETRTFYAQWSSKFPEQSSKLRFITDLQRALGWGSVNYRKNDKSKTGISLHAERFPWTEDYNEKFTFPLFKSAFEGFAGMPDDETLKLKSAKHDNGLSLTYEA